MSERDLVSIALNGWKPTIQCYVAMDRPTKITDILKSPTAQPTFGTNHQAANDNMVLTLQEELRAVREQLQFMTIQQAKTVAVVTAVPDNNQVRLDTACSQCNHRGDEHHREPRYHKPTAGTGIALKVETAAYTGTAGTDRVIPVAIETEATETATMTMRNITAMTIKTIQVSGSQVAAHNVMADSLAGVIKTCHHCNRKGHIKPTCWLYNSDRKKDAKPCK